MKSKIYALWFVVALTTFGLSLSLMGIGRYLQTVFSAEAKKEESVRILTVEEITYPPRVVEPTIVSVVEQSATNAESEENTKYEFYADGDYYIIGKLPKGFRDFESLSVQTTDYALASPENNYQDVHIPPKGYIFTNKEFNFKRIFVSKKRISFETETIKGISYKFVGKFVDETIDLGEYLEQSVLEGNLIKMRDGKKIAESKVNFATGGC